MSFSFQPKSEDEIKRYNLLDKGDYNFKVIKAEQKTSRSGNAMIEMALRVWGHDGREHMIYDYLLNSDMMAFKIRHFCYGTGMIDKYESGNFSPEDCEGRQGKIRVIIREDKTGQYPPKNAVVDYILDAEKSEEFINDDLPF